MKKLKSELLKGKQTIPKMAIWTGQREHDI